VPPWDTRLGGEIFIHGHGASRDWTRGCIALDNEDMRELYGLVDVGTPVTILP
jgi:lipoprotein-anchoring transpeptidase ErfK/SrfK